MSGGGNRGFADRLAGQGAQPGPRLPPRTGILGTRENRLAALANGGVVGRFHELVDPARCRIWEGHNRDYQALTEATCADLLESFRAQGRQEVPAIVRRVDGDAAYDFEVICGARRHWTVSWLRAHDYPEFRFLVEPRELTDEEAFRVADLENRSRKDLSDYERASDYARAIERYYGGSQQRMVERLQVTNSWLSRYLELARLPPEVLAAFGSPHRIGISHAAQLAPLLRHPIRREEVLAQAVSLQVEQAERAGGGETIHSPATVLKRLLAEPSERTRPSDTIEIRNEAGAILMQAKHSRGGGFTLFIPRAAEGNREVLVRGFSDLLDRLAAGKGVRAHPFRHRTGRA